MYWCYLFSFSYFLNSLGHVDLGVVLLYSQSSIFRCIFNILHRNLGFIAIHISVIVILCTMPGLYWLVGEYYKGLLLTHNPTMQNNTAARL